MTRFLLAALPASLVLASCAVNDMLTPGDTPPPPTPVGETGRSEAWSAPSPALIKAAHQQGFSDYQTQLDLARAGNEGALTRIQSWSAFAAAAEGEVAASHAVSLRELRVIQPQAFDRALAKQQSGAIQIAVIRALDDTED